MNEDFNPGADSGSPPDNPGDRLVSALEQLILGRWSPPGAPAHRLRDAFEEVDQEADQEKGNASPTMAARPCPEPDEWALLLGEASSPAELARANSLLAHAADCRACAERLRAFSANLSPEETAMLAGLSCSSAEGQRSLDGSGSGCVTADFHRAPLLVAPGHQP
jgi:hypothetical protein